MIGNHEQGYFHRWILISMVSCMYPDVKDGMHRPENPSLKAGVSTEPYTAALGSHRVRLDWVET
jgi:hypothetical protein